MSPPARAFTSGDSVPENARATPDMLTLTGFRYCPRCGARRLELHDTKAARCQSCGLVYYHNAAAAVVAIVTWGQRLLFIRRARAPGRGLWGLPGGFVDYGESLEAAVRRELREETALEVAALHYLGSAWNEYRYHEVTYCSADAYFSAPTLDPAELRCGDEILEASWLTLADAPLDELAFASFATGLQLYRSQLADTPIRDGNG